MQWAVPCSWSYEPLYEYRAFPKSLGFSWVSNKDNGGEFCARRGCEINLLWITRMTLWAHILFYSSSSKFLGREKVKENGLNYCRKALFWNLANTSEDDAYYSSIALTEQLLRLFWDHFYMFLIDWHAYLCKSPAMYGSWSLSCAYFEQDRHSFFWPLTSTMANTINIVSHPIINGELSKLRQSSTTAKEFREV